MVSYFVRYRGRASDPAAFARYYATEHAAILRGFPGIRSLIVHRPVQWRDPFPVQPSGSALIAQMQFDSVAALDAALASEARRHARDDFARFPPFHGDISHEAMTGTVIF